MDTKPVLIHNGVDRTDIFATWALHPWNECWSFSCPVAPMYSWEWLSKWVYYQQENNVKSYMLLTNLLEGTNINICLFVFQRESGFICDGIL